MENNPPPSMAGVEGFPRDAALTGSRYAETARGESRQLAQSFIIPARTGKAFPLMAGKIVRVLCVEGPQVADMIVFNLHDPNEKFWSGRTRVIHGGHLKVGDRLWSVPPQVRPMLTLIADTLEHPPHPFGARSHDLLYHAGSLRRPPSRAADCSPLEPLSSPKILSDLGFALQGRMIA